MNNQRGGELKCERCPKGATCELARGLHVTLAESASLRCPGEDPGATKASLVIAPGYWRFDNNSEILRCQNVATCPGGNQTTQVCPCCLDSLQFSRRFRLIFVADHLSRAQCGIGREGPLCAACKV